jgi:ribonucleoside-diphosphate reductase alpha chain
MAFHDELSRWVWEHRYRWRPPAPDREDDLEATWRRVARAVAAAEPRQREVWEDRFLDLLRDCRFLPGGRILANAGTGRSATLLNCFVMGRIEDSMPGICRALEESALTLQQGGGIGLDFSTLRPRGAAATASGTIASGPVSFMRIWNTMCATLLATGSRRGAMMATLRCDHPDILEFIDAKRDPAELRFFNLAVAVSDAFMAAARSDSPWPLVFPQAAPGVPGRIHCVVRARDLWERLLAANYETADPGVQFCDTINATNNLRWCEALTSTNPCGEAPLPPYGACNLGSINLSQFVRRPFTREAELDLRAIAEVARIAVRFLDDVLEVTRFPLPAQRETALASRRIGLGITGLADALVMAGLRYDTPGARDFAATAMRVVCVNAYEASSALAAEKGPFPALEIARYLAAPNLCQLPAETRLRIEATGTRNSHLTAIAPAGTISLLAGNVASGIEPMFAFEGKRVVLDATGQPLEFTVLNNAVRCWREKHGDCPLPAAFVTATGLEPEAHLRMQAALQPWVDGAIAKTINLPAAFPRERYRELFESAHRLGLKGCTTYRPGTARGQVAGLGEPLRDKAVAERCCTVA